jgi:hypothetical protein
MEEYLCAFAGDDAQTDANRNQIFAKNFDAVRLSALPDPFFHVRS